MSEVKNPTSTKTKNFDIRFNHLKKLLFLHIR